MACRGLPLDVDTGLLSAPHPGLISAPPPPPTPFSFSLAVCRGLSLGPLERLASLFLPSLSFELVFSLLCLDGRFLPVLAS